MAYYYHTNKPPMNTNEFNRQISELQLETVKLERRLQHIQDSINALIAMRRSADAIETPIFNETFGG